MPAPQNVFLSNGIKMPIFTGASQSSGQMFGNDVDIGDLFADYFISDLDQNNQNQLSALQIANAPVANPLLAPVAPAPPAFDLPTLTNPNETLDAPSQAPQPQNNQNGIYTNVTELPTRRGIKTAWHTGSLPNLQGGIFQVTGNILERQQQQQLKAQQAFAHLAKKVKPNDDRIVQNTSNSQNVLTTSVSSPVQSTQNAVSGGGDDKLKNATVSLSTGSAISGRLGFSMVGGQLSLPNRNAKVSIAGQSSTPESENSNLGMANASDSGGVSLPIGRGIRIGGQSGVVQQQIDATGNVTTSSVVPSSNWTSNSIWSSSGLMCVENGRGGLSEQVIAERRQRNREHAKRSRVRKKFLLESLQEQVRALQRENSGLRMLVYEVIPQHAHQIISECCKASPLFDDNINKSSGNKEVELVKSDYSLIESLSTGQQNFVLSDPRLPDNPIVFASEGFYRLTGYTREQVLGRNCRFLQGSKTDQQALDVIRTAIANGTDATACLLNYKADGTPFWNQFFVAALRDAHNNIVNYVGVQCAVEPEAGASALEDKVNSVMPLQDKDEIGKDNSGNTGDSGDKAS